MIHRDTAIAQSNKYITESSDAGQTVCYLFVSICYGRVQRWDAEPVQAVMVSCLACAPSGTVTRDVAALAVWDDAQRANATAAQPTSR